jgi:YD repeat-containing protein
VEATKFEVVASGVASDPIQTEQQLQPRHKTEFKYNKLGDLTEETATDLLTGEAHTLTRAHDALGNRTHTVLPNLKQLESTQRSQNYLHCGSGHLPKKACVPQDKPVPTQR